MGIKMSEVEVEKEKETMSNESGEKKKVSLTVKEEWNNIKEFEPLNDYFKGFMRIHVVISILNLLYFITILLTYTLEDEIFQPILYILILIFFTIIISVISFFTRNRNRYKSIGMITAILGPLLYFFKKEGKQFVDSYTDHPKKKKIHFLIGFLLSIEFLINITPLILLGWLWSQWDLWIIPTIIIMVLNNSIGLLLFFLRENLRYISLGMVLLPIICIIPLLLFGWINAFVIYFVILVVFGILIRVIH